MNNLNTNALLQISENLNSNLDFLNIILINNRNYYKEILLLFKNLIAQVITENNSNSNINLAILNLNVINNNISKIQELIEETNNLKSEFNSMENNELKNKVKNYNYNYMLKIKEIFNTSKEIQEYILTSLDKKISTYNLNTSTNEIVENTPSDNTVVANSSNNEFQLLENTLIIAEDKISLPYSISEISEIYKNNPDTYNSIYDVLQKLYVVPSNTYKHSAISRFREAYKLAIKSKKRKSTALKLGLELFTNYNLHPAIITACKDLNELDIYLSCLEYDELDDFNFFTVQYDIKPAKLFKPKSLFPESLYN